MFSPDGAVALTISKDGTVRLWDSEHGISRWAVRHKQLDRAGEIARFSPNGSSVSTFADGAVRLINVDTGREAIALPHPDGVHHLIFSPDKERIVTCLIEPIHLSGAIGCRLWHFASQSAVPLEISSAPQFNADGTRLFGNYPTDATRVRLIDGRTGNLITDLQHERNIVGVSFAPNGKSILTASLDGTAVLWESDRGTRIKSFSHSEEVNEAIFSPDGGRILTRTNTTLRLWSAATGEEVKTVAASALQIWFTPDGARVVSLLKDRDRKLSVYKIWDGYTGDEIATIENSTDIGRPSFLAETSIFAIGTETAVQIVDGRRGILIAILPHERGFPQFNLSPDGSRFATANRNSIALWEGFRGPEIAVFRQNHDGSRSPFFSRDGTRILTHDGSQAYLWDKVRGVEVATLMHDAKVSGARFSPNGTRALTYGEDGKARIWDVAVGNSIAILPHGGPVEQAEFDRSGQLLVTLAIDGARVWDGERGVPLGHLTHPGSRIRTAIVSPDGHRAATRTFENFVGLWEPRSGSKVTTLRHDEHVESVTFDLTGGRLATASRDRTARIWDAVSGDLIAELIHPNWVQYAEFSPDGRRLLTLCKDGKVRLWEIKSRHVIAVMEDEDGWSIFGTKFNV